MNLPLRPDWSFCVQVPDFCFPFRIPASKQQSPSVQLTDLQMSRSYKNATSQLTELQTVCGGAQLTQNTKLQCRDDSKGPGRRSDGL